MLNRNNDLIIVESPTKSNLFKNLGYNSIYTLGHFTELDVASFLNIKEIEDIKIIPKKNNYSYIENQIKNTKGNIIISTDPDIEGEAIAFSLYQIAKKYKKEIYRVPLYGLSPKNLENVISLKNARNIDKNFVMSVFTRQVIDKLLFSFFKKYIAQDYNIGRVQFSILKILQEYNNYERYKINNFHFLVNSNIENFDFKLSDNKNLIYKVDLPYNTYSILYDSSIFLNDINISFKKIAEILQKLYIDNAITYPRTTGVAIEEFSYKLLKFKLKNYYELENFIFTNNYENAISPIKLSLTIQNQDVERIFELILRKTISFFLKPIIISGINIKLKLENNKIIKIKLGYLENTIKNYYIGHNIITDLDNIEPIYIGNGISEIFLLKILNNLNIGKPSTIPYLIYLLERKELIEKNFTQQIKLLPNAEKILGKVEEKFNFINLKFLSELNLDILNIEKGLNNYKFPILKLIKYFKKYNIEIPKYIDFNLIDHEELIYKNLWFDKENNEYYNEILKPNY